jgi:hypothetical protein
MSIASDLNGFTHLKHLVYFEHYDFWEYERDRRENLASHARNLAEAVPGLVTITNVSPLKQSYTFARLTRGENERDVSVEVGNGCRLKIGYEDQAFP